MNLGDVGDDLNRPRRNPVQDFSRHRPGGHAANCFTRRSTSPALPVSDAVFRFVGEIRMRRAVGRFHLRVSVGACVLVQHQDGNRRAQRAALEYAGENLAAVSFVARSDDPALTGPTAIKLALDVFFAQLNSRRAAIDDNTDATAMRFAPGGNAKELAEAAAHWQTLSVREFK